MGAIPDAVARYREQYRAEEISPRYRGWLHFAFTSMFALGGIAWCASRIVAPTALEWLAVPLTFLYANLAEYWGHRIPMHRPIRGLGLVYRRHSKQHHRFFTHDAMELESARDLKAVLFPPLLVTFFFGAFALPAWLAIAWLATPNAAYFFVATALAYFYNYELLHFAYHLPTAHPVARLPGIAQMRRLHHVHHDQALMASRNFNITYPIGDLLFRTLAKGNE
jgi:hypothetical protein